MHSFGYMFRFYQTIFRPIFVIWRYISTWIRFGKTETCS